MSAETCPHYLAFASKAVPPGATQYKCAPPLRDGQNQQKLLQALEAGTLDGVASDHSPVGPLAKYQHWLDFFNDQPLARVGCF